MNVHPKVAEVGDVLLQGAYILSTQASTCYILHIALSAEHFSHVELLHRMEDFSSLHWMPSPLEMVDALPLCLFPEMLRRVGSAHGHQVKGMVSA